MRCAWLLTVTTREPGTGSICSSSSPVRAKGPRWLVPSCSSNPSRVACLGGSITPALLTSRSILGCLARSSPRGGADGIQRGQVEGLDRDVRAGGGAGDAGGGALALLGVPHGQHHRRAARGEDLGGLEPQAGVRAGDHG